MSSCVVAIHQPNFLPWLGYFNKIFQSQKFIILDDVQFPKKGGSWLNRVRLRIGQKEAWATIPVRRSFHGVQTCRETEINDDEPWREKLLKSIEQSYAKTPFFDEVFLLVEDILGFETKSLVEFNLNGLRLLMSKLGLAHDKLVLSSSHNCQEVATQRLIKLVKSNEGDAYLCGGGAAGYQEDQMFLDANIDVIYQDYNHPVYHQAGHNSFIPGLSIVDALMNCGYKDTSQLFQKSKVCSF